MNIHVLWNRAKHSLLRWTPINYGKDRLFVPWKHCDIARTPTFAVVDMYDQLALLVLRYVSYAQVA